MYFNVLQMYYKCIQIYEHDSAHFLFAPGVNQHGKQLQKGENYIDMYNFS